MRQLNKNKQTLYYSNFDSVITINEYDEDGNILTTNVDGEEVPCTTTKEGYSTPVKFKANISFNSGDTRMAEYGLNTGDYNAIISAEKGMLPFNERTLIWHTSEPQYDGDGYIKPESADYKVVSIKTSLNEERFILKKRVEEGGQVVPPSA